MTARRRELALYAVVGLVSSLLLVPAFGLLHGHLAIPFDYSGDALAVSVHAKGILDHGWIDLNPDVGAPWGKHTNDFPGADNLHLLVMAAMGLVSGRWPLVLNGYFLLTFPLAALAATWWFRSLGLSRPVTATLAVLYAYAPYHFGRGEAHLFLAGYYAVPLALVLVHRVFTGEALWGAGRRSAWAAAGILALLGTSSSYYSIFVLVLLTLGAALAWATSRSWRRVGGVLAAQALLVGVMVVNMLPNLLFEARHGNNPVALVRAPADAEKYAFKLTSLVLPWTGSRFAGLADFRHSYDKRFPFPSERPALGLVAAVGLVVLLWVLVSSALARRAGDHRLRSLGALGLVMFLMGTVGGGGTLFVLFVSDNLRGWNRLVILLAAVCLAAVGVLLDRLLRARPRPVVALACLLVLGVGLADQVPAYSSRDRDRLVTAWDDDQAFVDTIQRALPADAIVFQLPYMTYPEASRVVGLRDSDQYRLYLHSTTVRWTYGGIRGRSAADWSVWVAQQPVPRMLALLAAAHVDGLTVARAGYTDRGAAVEAALGQAVGALPVVSPDGRTTFWDLTAYGEKLRAGLDPALLAAAADRVVLHPTAYPQGFPGTSPSVLLDNGRSSTEPVDLTLQVLEPTGRRTVEVTWPDGFRETVSPSAVPVTLTRHLDLPPGRSSVRLSVADGPPLRLIGLACDDVALTRLVAGL